MAVLDPVLADSGYPDTGLAGVGVVFKLIQALLEKAGRDSRPAPLHEARLDRHRGRRRRAQGREPAVRQARPGRACATSPTSACGSLIEACGLGRRKISEGDLGFRLGPRINAAGRMGMTDLAVRLFFSEDVGRDRRPSSRSSTSSTPSARRRRSGSSTRPAERVEARGPRQEVQVPRPGQPRLAPRRHRHRRLQAQGLLQPAGRPVRLRGRQGPRLGPEHLGGPADRPPRGLPAPLPELRRAPPGRRLHPADGPHGRVPGRAEPAGRGPHPESRACSGGSGSTDRSISPRSTTASWRSSPVSCPSASATPSPCSWPTMSRSSAIPRSSRASTSKFLARQNGRVLEALGWDKADWRHVIHRGSRVSVAFSVMTSEYLGEQKTNLSIEDLKT
ncbi:MAG: hypothetical protein MZV64_49665 [Ignavibacteriales bacterium]|nr:hypothetical protein [Ignavibacteriales bacterium]